MTYIDNNDDYEDLEYITAGNRLKAKKEKANSKKTPSTPFVKKKKKKSLKGAIAVIAVFGTLLTVTIAASQVDNNREEANVGHSYTDENLQRDENGDIIVDEHGNAVFKINPGLTEEQNYKNWLDYENRWRKTYGHPLLENNADTYKIFLERTEDGSTVYILGEEGRKHAGGK